MINRYRITDSFPTSEKTDTIENRDQIQCSVFRVVELSEVIQLLRPLEEGREDIGRPTPTHAYY